MRTEEIIQTLVKEKDDLVQALYQIGRRKNLSAASAIVMRNIARDALKEAGVLVDTKPPNAA